jgi:RimJ/RimL family protein N-acetyltransferase
VIIELDTERLRLRQWRASDRTPFAELNADPRVMEFFPSRLDRQASDALAERIEAKIAQRGWGLWAAELRATGEFIGFIGLQPPAAQLPCSPCVEVGWRLAQRYWGKGLATEGARAALAFGFGKLGLDEIVSFTVPANRRSRAVMERLGMQEDKAGAFEHPSIPPGSPLRLHCLYRLRLGRAVKGDRAEQD